MGEQNLFPNSREDITAEGKRHRGAVIGSKEYREEYVNDLVKDWDNQILLTIAEAPPLAAYTAFVSEFKRKLNYFLKTSLNICHLLLPLEKTKISLSQP